MKGEYCLVCESLGKFVYDGNGRSSLVEYVIIFFFFLGGNLIIRGHYIKWR